MENQVDMFLSIHHLNGIIRIFQEEYSGIPQDTQFVHFVLAPTTVQQGKSYALPRILQSGQRGVAGDEKLPILSFENIFMGECVDVQQSLSYGTLTERDFKHSLTHIQNPQQLKACMLKRYRASRPHMSDQEIIERGVSRILLTLRSNSQM